MYLWRENMKNDNIEIIEETEDGICKITVKGRIDSNNADYFLNKLENTMNEGNKVIVLNMSRVEYLSSIGIRMILKIYKQAAETGGKFNIERPSEIVKNILGMTALNEMMVTK